MVFLDIPSQIYYKKDQNEFLCFINLFYALGLRKAWQTIFKIRLLAIPNLLPPDKPDPEGTSTEFSAIGSVSGWSL
jgi:hypothetical protein